MVSMSPPSGMWILNIFPKFFLCVCLFFLIYIFFFCHIRLSKSILAGFLRGNASVHLKGSLKFWVTQSSFRADANFNGEEEEEEEDQRLHFFAFNPKKWWGNKTKGWMPCHNSLQKSISKQKKKKKNNYTVHDQHAGFFINIMSLFHSLSKQL